jgi:DNA polymerase-3 subunit epsilon
VLFDSLLKPMKLVHPEARMVNKITDDDLKQAPTFPEIYETISQYVKNRKILAYNSDFDRRMLRQTCQKYGLEKLYVKGWDCVMEKYGYFWGWRDGLNTYKPQSLVDACAQQKIQIFNAHNAKYDCLLTLKLIIAVASTKD